MGSLYMRGAIVWLKYHQNGRQIRESSGTSKKSVARRMLRAREGDVEKGIPIVPRAGRVSFHEASQDLLTDYEVNGRATHAHAKRRLDLHLEPFFRGRLMATITTADIRTFAKSRQDAGAANGEINRELAVLKRMYSLAMQGGKLHARPHIPMLREQNVRTGFFEAEQFVSVRAHLPAALRPVVTFAYLTGWRVPSEVLTLQWRQVDLEAGTVRLDAHTTKNDAGRLLPYGEVLPELKEVLRSQRDATKALERKEGVIVPWVFHRDGKPIKDFRGAWDAACKAAGCPSRIPHDFRRTAVRNLVRAAVPERVAMQITGHKTRSVFDRYDIVNEADLKEGLRKLGNATSGTI
jgi:integrase